MLYAYNYMPFAYSCQPRMPYAYNYMPFAYNFNKKKWRVLGGYFFDQAQGLDRVTGVTGAQGTGIRTAYHRSTDYEFTV